MTRCTAMLTLVMMLPVSSPSPAQPADSVERTLVVVASAHAPFEDISPSEVRLSYLAVPVRKGNNLVRPVLNESSSLLHEVFLQKVIFLSSDHYRRQVVAQVFRRGGVRPPVARNEDSLLNLLADNPASISYMWQRDVSSRSELKTLGILWQGIVQ